MSNEAGRGGDAAVLTIVQGGPDAEETPISKNGPGSEASGDSRNFCGTEVPEEVPETEESEELTPEDYQQAAMNLAGAIARAYQSGEPVDAVLCNPALKEGLEAAFRALPDEVIPEPFRSQLPFDANPEIGEVKLLTRSDIEAGFLFRYFGETKDGGNGLIPRMQAGLQRANSPVRLTPDFLRTLYLLELQERVDKRIVVPTGAQLNQGLVLK